MRQSPYHSTTARTAASRAKAVGAFVPGLTRKSFEKYGFSTATLLTDWEVIAGRDLASFTLPERLKWPRNVNAYEELAAGDAGRPGATLVLRVDGPRAIDVQYQTAQIIERINAHFGYRAVGEIRFIQAPLPKRHARPAARPPATHGAGPGAGTPKAVAGAALARAQTLGDDNRLAAALKSLEANIARDRERTKP